MCDKELCYNLHAIKTITDDSLHRNLKEAPNSTVPYVDDQHFWRQDDPHDYYHSIWHDKASEQASRKSDSPISYILWMDSDKEELSRMTKHLGSDPRVHITFQETFALATHYLLQNIDKIKSLPESSIFQIICRGYYASEDKNALHLLLFLNHHHLQYVPIVVITADKPGVLHHFRNQASSMGIQDWRSRIYVTDNSADLITKINANLIDKYAARRR